MTMLTSAEDLRKTYDVIICGGGSAGCVLAARLSENPAIDVLLLEAGGSDQHPLVRDSRLWMHNIGSERDWAFRAQPSVGLNGRAVPLPMGKVLGGGSSINGLVWARGHRSDFDGWAALTGDPGWSYAQIVELYKGLEDWRGPADSARRGTGGPVTITLPPDPIPVASALTAAMAGLGIPAVDDVNGAIMEGDGGGGIANVTMQPDGQRVSMASAFIRPNLARPNLSVLLGAHCVRLGLAKGRARSIELVTAQGRFEVATNHEIILAAGAIQTPKILMLSGIGDPTQLAPYGIEVAQDLPGVGANFHDHILLAGCIWEYRQPEPPRNNSAEFTFFAKSSPHLSAPDLQPVLEETAFASPEVAARYRLPEGANMAWTLAPGLVRPKSRGHLALTSVDPRVPLAIHADFLSHDDDLRALIQCVDLCREIGNSSALRDFVRREVMPGPLSPADMADFVRDAAGTYFHQCGTARMGRDSDSVVDGQLRVHGIEGLRIADASVMPFVTTGNTMAPCAVIGARAADLILSAHS